MQALTTDTRLALQNLLTTCKMHTRKGRGQGHKAGLVESKTALISLSPSPSGRDIEFPEKVQLFKECWYPNSMLATPNFGFVLFTRYFEEKPE